MQPWQAYMCYKLETTVSAFVLDLHSSGLILQYRVDRTKARDVYNQRFKVKRTSFSAFLSTMRWMSLIVSKTSEEIVFNRNNLDYILQYSENGEPPHNISPRKQSPRKSVIVSQSLAFKQKRKPQEVVTENLCKICNVTFNNKFDLDVHILDVRHNMRQMYAVQRNAFLKLHPEVSIEVEPGRNWEKESLVLKSSEGIIVNIINRSNRNYQLADVIQLNLENPEIIVTNVPLPCDLLPKQQVAQVISSCSDQNTSVIYPQVFILKCLADGKEYKVLKELVLHLQPVYGDLAKDLLPTAPYQKTKPIYIDRTDEVILGEPVERLSNEFKFVKQLGRYELPGDMVRVLNKGLTEFEGMTPSEAQCLQNIKSLLNTPCHENSLTVNNYYKLLHLLLFLEEHQMSKDIHDYDRVDQVLKPVKGYRKIFYELEVPGLAEHRPSIIYGDSVYIKVDPNSTVKYQGVVHTVKESSVVLGLNARFTNEAYVNNRKFTIFFTFNRYTLKVEHQAVELSAQHNIARFFFPKTLSPYEKKNFEYVWFEKKISTNPEQKEAVRCIVERKSYPAPFLIFGPPGTGKTMTLVEAIKQVWKMEPQEKMLVCAPSNSAANELARRLVGNIPTTDMIRFVAHACSYSDIPREVLPYINYKDREFFHPSMDDLRKYRIVVTTLTNSARLVNGGIPTDHFSYVFIDESGHATESETLVAIAGLVTDKKATLNAQIVLVGDPKQLGPIIHSSLAKEYGFGTSMLERMMNTLKLYQKDANGKYNSRVLVKLLRNYRSHQTILHIPNLLFYDKELLACGEDLINVGLNWEHLSNPKFPIIFHNICGCDEREENSPSFFNIQEAVTVTSYLEKLINTRLCGMVVRQNHIAVVSPYRKQVQKISKACAQKNWNEVTVGSPEQLQGQERLIVIISTVRSRSNFMKFDHKFRLGFLKNEKRFNVAITRAKALLIVVGNADLLQLDPCWKTFIDYCIDNGGYKGKLPSPLPEDKEVDTVASELEQLSLQDINRAGEGANFSRGRL